VNLLATNKLLDLAISGSAYLDACILGAGIIQMKIILQQSKKIDDLKQDFNEINAFHKSLNEREDIPADIIEHLANLNYLTKTKKE
jgi:hypothetical protein